MESSWDTGSTSAELGSCTASQKFQCNPYNARRYVANIDDSILDLAKTSELAFYVPQTTVKEIAEVNRNSPECCGKGMLNEKCKLKCFIHRETNIFRHWKKGKTLVNELSTTIFRISLLKFYYSRFPDLSKRSIPINEGFLSLCPTYHFCTQLTTRFSSIVIRNLYRLTPYSQYFHISFVFVFKTWRSIRIGSPIESLSSSVD